MIKAEIVDLPQVGGRYKDYVSQALELPEGKALKLTGLTLKEANSIRQACFRVGRLRSKVERDGETVVLYIYKRKEQ